MAQLAIPLILLGGMYVVSNRRSPHETLEGYVERPVPPQQTPQQTPQPQSLAEDEVDDDVSVLPPVDRKVLPHVNHYDPLGGKVPDADRVSQHHSRDLYDEGVRTNAVGHTMLTGELITEDNFKHKNMVPFFGSKVRGLRPEMDVHEAVLDNMQGAGSLRFEKRETGSFFKSQDGFSNIHGAKNHNDFYMQRMNPSMKMEKTMPFEPERVGPGLGKGFGAEGHAGFNAGMESREAWMPRSVDDLRAATSQKATGLELRRMGGPGGEHVKRMGQIGRIEKHGPDSHFEYTPDLWNVGIKQGALGQTFREEPGEKSKRLLNKSFDHGTQMLSGAAPVKHAYGGRNYLPSKRMGGLSDHNPILEHLNVDRARPANPTANDQHIFDGQTHKSTYRAVQYDSEGEKPGAGGAVQGALKALLKPIVHVIKPTQKEDVFVRHRNLNNAKQQIQNPEARDFEVMQAPTNREILEGKLGLSHVQSQPQQQMPSRDKNYQFGTIREATQKEYVGGSTGFAASGAADNHHLNQYQTTVDRTVETNRAPSGNASIFEPVMHARIEKQHGLHVEPRLNGAMGHIAIPSVHTFGVTNSPFSLTEKSTVNDRLDPDLLDAFKKNPFTHSLHSVA